MFFPTTFYIEYMLFLTTLYMLLLKYIYSLVVPASPVAMVQVGYILRCMLLCYLHEPWACGPLSCK